MAATDGEYTLDDALSDLWFAGKEMDFTARTRAETWIRGRIAESECQTASPDRLAALEEQQRNFAYWTVAMDGRLRVLEEQLRDAQSLLNEADRQAPEQTYVQNPLCCDPFATFSGTVHCGKPAGHTDGHAALNEHHHVTVWGRPEQYEALPQPAPCPEKFQGQPCELLRGHDGPHRRDDPADPSKKVEWDTVRLRQRFDGLFSTGGVHGQPAPDHLSEGRLPKRDPATGQLMEQECEAWTPMPDGPDISCARQRHHDGPHMDATAIAHAGKAGEVWT